MKSIDRRTVLRGGLGLGVAPLGAMLMAASSNPAAVADTNANAQSAEFHDEGASADRHPFDLEFLYRRHSILRSPPDILGPTPTGLRVNLYTEGGRFEGPKMKGTVLPGFGDAFVLRRDGVGIIDSRNTMQTDDGALIFVHYMGVVDFGQGAFEKALTGTMPTQYSLHAAPRFDTAHPKYAWLNRIQGVGIGVHDPAKTTNLWEFYAIR
jgi:hypothetical protein